MDLADVGNPPRYELQESSQQHLNEVYEVGWICALRTELAAARAMLDEDRGIAQFTAVGDPNTYAIGRIHQHNVVIACLPAGIDGTNAASAVAQNMMRTFPQIRIGLLVGIGGGIPNLAKGIDIRLGDIVVSQPDGEHGGVIQYAKGKLQTEEGLSGYKFVRKGSLNKPPTFVLNALKMLQAEHETDDSRVPSYLKDMLHRKPKMKKTGYTYPGADRDHLFESETLPPKVDHTGENVSTAEYCEVSRPLRESFEPVIHYGNILSGDLVIKHASVRDALRDGFGAICVEMEAAGLMDTFPCLVVRGICDYADCFKNDFWHPYAAAVAAAYAKEFLLYISPQQMHQGQIAREVVDPKSHQLLGKSMQLQESTLNHHHEMAEKSKIQHEKEQDQRCHQSFACIYEEYKDVNPDRAPGTCRWILQHPQFQAWQKSNHNDLLWISADPGCGKSVFTKSVIDHELPKTPQTICYFFFKDNAQQDSLPIALKALLHQLFSQQPQLLTHARSIWEQKGDKASYEVKEMWRIFVNATSDPSANSTYCVLDALDECREDDRRTLLTMMSKRYQESSTTASEYALKFLVTSRPYASVERGFNQIISELPQIRLRGEDENDKIRDEINLVISQRVEELAKTFMLSQSSRDSLQAKLLQMENRTYLWLHLAMDEIYSAYQNSFDPEDAQIDSVPASVNDAYERILGKIEPKAKPNARKVLMIIVGSQRPLTIGEMALALSSSRMYDSSTLSTQPPNTARLELQIREWCGLFVFINHSKLFLIHQTAKEFLLAQGPPSSFEVNVWKSSLAMPEIRKEMVKLCVQHLHAYSTDRSSLDIALSHESTTEKHISRSEAPTEAERHGFFAYCAQHWAFYLDDQSVTEDKILLGRILHVCDTGGAIFPSWFPVMWNYSGFLGGRDALRLADQHLFALIGQLALLKEVSSRKAFDVNACDGEGNTALVWAAFQGHASIVEYLLNIGADDNAQGEILGSALHAASENGHKDVVRILLDRNVDVNIRDSRCQTPLFLAAYEGQLQVVQMLLEEKEVDINIPDQNGMTPLMRVSLASNSEVVKVLLSISTCNVNSKNRFGQTALSLAAETGELEIVKLLLACNDIDVNVEDENSQTPLSLAVLRGSYDLVKVLLDKRGVNVDWKDQDGCTCDLYALERGQKRIARLLLENSSINVGSKEEESFNVTPGSSETLNPTQVTEDRKTEESTRSRTRPISSDRMTLAKKADASIPSSLPADADIDTIMSKLLQVRPTKSGQTNLVQLRAKDIEYLCAESREIFLAESSLLELEGPLQICGELRANYSSLLRIFDVCGRPPDVKYLFLGNYVDRGPQSLETMCLLLALKIKYPDRIFLLQGNHECASINRIYGFFDECKRRYSMKLWKSFTRCHDCLPLAAVVGERIFAVHGGLSPDLDSLDQIRQIQRPVDVPDTGLICDLLWSSPDDDGTGWKESNRGVSFTFGSDVVSQFVQKHGLQLICRSNSIVEDGYEFFAGRQLVTLFSLPHYNEEFDNSGAVMGVDEDLVCSFQVLTPQARLRR